MHITDEVMKQIAELAHLQMDDEESRVIAKDIENIMQYAIDKLGMLTIGTEEKLMPSLSNVFRDDIVTPSLSREQLLQNAPEQAQGYFCIPNVMRADIAEDEV